MKGKLNILYSTLGCLLLLSSCAKEPHPPIDKNPSSDQMNDGDIIDENPSSNQMNDGNIIDENPSSDQMNNGNIGALFPVGTNLQEMISVQPAIKDTAYVYKHSSGQSDTILLADFFDVWEEYSGSDWIHNATITIVRREEIPVKLYLPLEDEFGLNRITEHVYSNLLTCVIVAPRFTLEDQPFWDIIEEFHLWSKNNDVQVVAYVDDSGNDAFTMGGALGLSLQVNATNRDYLYPLTQGELGMIVMYKGIILGKLTLEDFPDDLSALVNKVPEWKAKSKKQ